jgi:hypothetical protein
MVSRAVSSSTGVVAVGAHAAQDFETVDAGQADVEHQHGRVETLRQRIVAVVDGMHGETMRIEYRDRPSVSTGSSSTSRTFIGDFLENKQRKNSA